ncbi:hypothetical protein BC940DRAFT_329652 [Gongronella butleri]|nr:hypothetical protein BC940DRAFT_329652 [Gongronella butleri]
MKFSIAALLAVTATAVSAYTTEGTIYIYVNSLPHPRTSFVKTGSNSQIVTNGKACSGNSTLPAQHGALTGVFTTVDNQWDFNGKHDNEIWMGYIKIKGTNNCLSLTENKALVAKKCPSFSQEIKKGNKFAWFKDKRNSAMWAYGGDKDAIENNGIGFDGVYLQTKGKPLNGVKMNSDPLDNVFLGLGHVSLGHSGHGPQGCE